MSAGKRCSHLAILALILLLGCRSFYDGSVPAHIAGRVADVEGRVVPERVRVSGGFEAVTLEVDEQGAFSTILPVRAWTSRPEEPFTVSAVMLEILTEEGVVLTRTEGPFKVEDATLTVDFGTIELGK